MILPDDLKDNDTLTAKVRNVRGGTMEVPILDLSAAGCMINPRGVGLAESDRVLVKLEGLEFMPAYVLWIEDNRAGIGFERVIHETVLEHLKSRIVPRKAA